MELLGASLFIVIAVQWCGAQDTPHTQSYYYRRWAAIAAARYYSWEVPIIPNVERARVETEMTPKFHGKIMDSIKTTCDKACQMQRSSRPSNLDELKSELKYDTLDLYRQTQLTMSLDLNNIPKEMFNDIHDVRNDDAISNDVMDVIEEEDLTGEYSDLPEDEENPERKKREIFGTDTRFTISAKKFLHTHPFSSAVKTSTGCSAIMISPRHALTSAHCLHDGKKYVKGARKIKIGKLTDVPKKNRRGKNRTGGKRKKNGGKRRNSKKKSPKRVKRAPLSQNDFSGNKTTMAKSVEPYVKWTKAKRLYIPTQWTNSNTSRNNSAEDYPIEFDFAVIELRKDIAENYLDIGISPEKNKIPGKKHNVHFTGFDSDRPDFVFRFCPVEEESPDIIYHYCDAVQGTSGSGVYIKLFDTKLGGYHNRVVAVFSGHQQVVLPDGKSESYNTAVRITPIKYTLICHWTNGYNKNCNNSI